MLALFIYLKKEVKIMIWTLIIAWILTWFSLDDLLITGINEICSTNYTVAVYWVIAFVIGAIVYILNKIKE